jgi:hypothetical protein
VARIKNITNDALSLFTPDAPRVQPGDVVTISDDKLTDRAWQKATWEIVEPPTGYAVFDLGDAVTFGEHSTGTPSEGVEGKVTDLRAMTKAELKVFASERGIDLAGATTKTEIITAIQASLDEPKELQA